jgi:hypothetical protein
MRIIRKAVEQHDGRAVERTALGAGDIQDWGSQVDGLYSVLVFPAWGGRIVV